MKIGMKLAVLAAFVALTACGSSSSESRDVHTCVGLFCDVGGEDTAVDEVVPDTAPEADIDKPIPGCKLTFVDQFGDDQKTCIQSDVCTFNVSFQAERGLKVKYACDGEPQENAAIVYTVVEDPDSLGKMNVGTVYSNAEGLATGTVKVVKQVNGVFKVKATVYGNTLVEPIYFVINAAAKIDAYLTVSFIYNGSKMFDGVTVYLFKSGQPAAADLACADIDKLELPTADLQNGPVQLAQTAKFVMLPGLEDEKEQFYTIVARGEMVDGTAIAYGCDDQEGHVLVTSSKHVTITLKDIPPRIVGKYDVQTTMDLVSALPDNVQIIVNFLLNFFEKPSASILLLACELGGGTLEDFCGWVFSNPQDPDIYALTTMGNIILEIIDSFLSAAVEQWTGYDIFGIGEDVRDIIKELTLKATFDIKCEPDENGYIPDTCTSASWHTVSIRWRYGLECPPNDDSCGRIDFNIQAIGQDVVLSKFPATLMYVNDYSELTIGEHSLLIKYGQLINYILQKFVLPRVFGDGSDGLPVVDSYEKLFLSLLGGGKECLQPSPSQKACCLVFAESVFGQTGSVGTDVLKQACDTLVQLGSAYLEQTLVQLDTTTGDTFKLSTRDGQPCKLFDLNADQKIDAWGQKEPESERCVWDLEINVFGAFADIDKNNFFGSEHQ